MDTLGTAPTARWYSYYNLSMAFIMTRKKTATGLGQYPVARG